MTRAALLLLLAGQAAAAGYSHRLDRAGLTLYSTTQGRRRAIYRDAGAAALTVVDAPAELLGGAPAFLYRAKLEALGQDDLIVVALAPRRARRVGRFPSGRVEDVDGDGRPEVVARRQPLGPFFRADCPGVHAPVAGAYKSEVHAWRNDRFTDVSAEFPDFFAERIARGERRLETLSLTRDTAEFLGAALSLYYDHAARGKAARGLERLEELLAPAPESCRADLLKKLSL